MKKTLTTIALLAVTVLSAQGYQTYGNSSYNSDNSNYSDNNRSGYVNQRNPYSQNNGPNGDIQVTVRRYDSEPQSQNYAQDQSYYQQQGSQNPRDYQTRPYQGYSQNQGYYQQSGTPQTGYTQTQGYTSQSQGYYQDNQNTGRDDRNFKPVADQELVKKIHDKLSSGWFSKGYQNVAFDVTNGNVALRGTVETLADKAKVEDTIKGIDGVRQVNNQITIANPQNTNTNTATNRNDIDYNYRSNRNTYDSNYNSTTADASTQKKGAAQDYAATDSDRQINAKIRDKLNGGWFSKGYDTVVIRTTDGVVVLSGTVDDASESQKINDNVRSVEGVKAVNNQLQVKK